jgi:hypothetical protein
MADLVTRLLLKSQQFDDTLGKSTAQVRAFEARMKGVGSSVTGVIGTVGKFVPAIGAGMGAMEAFNKIMGSSQTTGDAFVRVQEQAKASVDAFFTSISMGDFSGFLKNMDNVISRAGEMADALDRLDTQKIFTDSELAELNSQYRIKMAEARNRAEGSPERNKALAEARAVREQINALKSSLADTYNKSSIATLATAMAKQGYKKDVTKIAETEDGQKFLAAVLRQSNQGNLEELSDKYKKKRKSLNGMLFSEVALSKWAKTGEGALAEFAYYFKELDDSEQSMLKQAINFKNVWHETRAEIAEADRDMGNTYARINGGSKNSGSKNGVKAKEMLPDGSLADINKRISELTKELSMQTSEQMRVAIQKAINDLNREKHFIEFGVKFNTTDQLLEYPGLKLPGMRNIAEDLKSGYIQQPKRVFAKEDIETNLDFADSLDAINGLFSEMGGLMDGAAGSWAGYAATVAAAVSKLLPQLASLFAASAATGVADKASLPFPYNIIAMAATAAGLVAAIASVPKFADGGIIGGSSFVGDKLLARVNSGEMILNQNQQNSLLSLVDGENRAGNITFTLRGDELIGAINNHNKKNRR